MTTQLFLGPYMQGPTPEQVRQKMARRLSRKQGLFAPELLKTALKQAFVMLRPDIQWKNPVMFVVEIGTVLTLIYTIAAIFGYGSVSVGYLIALDVWLLLTVLFANFASALAEARGKAQADSLRKTRQTTPAFRVPDYQAPMLGKDTSVNGDARKPELEEISSTDLQAGDVVLVHAGQIIPGDGEIIEG